MGMRGEERHEWDPENHHGIRRNPCAATATGPEARLGPCNTKQCPHGKHRPAESRRQRQLCRDKIKAAGFAWGGCKQGYNLKGETCDQLTSSISM